MSRVAAAICVLLFVTDAFAVNAGLGEVPETVKRETPLSTTQGYFQYAHAGEYELAAHYLDLSHVPEQARATRGPRLARRLKFVLDHKLALDLSKVSTHADGDPQSPSYEQLGAVMLDKQTIPIRLKKVDGEWLFSGDTVRSIDRLYDAYGPPFGERMPELLLGNGLWGIEPWQWLGLLAVLALAFVFGLLFERILLAAARRMAKLTSFAWDDELVVASRGPLRLILFGVAVAVGTRFLLIPTPTQWLIDTLVRSLIIVTASWFVLRVINVAADQLTANVASSTDPQGTGRGVRTQLAVLRRVFQVAIYAIGAALLLLQFEIARNVGVSLLASAGIAGLVIGLAAQKSISALLAGIQLSVTQPVRIGDTVNIEGEIGTIEEITLTYVIVCVWDLRRLIVPVTYFLDNRFQNWTRRDPAMLGTIMLEADFRADLDAIRAELDRVLKGEGAALWDTKVGKVQVTEARERTIGIRALVSARNSGDLFDLRCLVRERLVQLMRQHPQWLPTTRLDTQAQPAVPAAGPVTDT